MASLSFAFLQCFLTSCCDLRRFGGHSNTIVVPPSSRWMKNYQPWMLLDYFKLPKTSSSLLTNLKLSLTCSAMLTHSLTHSLTGVVAIVSKTIGGGGSRALSGVLILIILWMLEGGRPQRSVRSCSSGRSSGHSGHTNYPRTSTTNVDDDDDDGDDDYWPTH